MNFVVLTAALSGANAAVRWLARVDLRPLADELAAQVCLELEFDREARSTERVRQDNPPDEWSKSHWAK